jgi:eukaryotic-like serine/threonine-protein kinase
MAMRSAVGAGAGAVANGPTKMANASRNMTSAAVEDAPVVRAGGSAAQLEEARDRYTELSSRAGAVDGSLNNLRRQQEAAGYGLRGDMAAADNQLQSYLRAADQDLRSSNAVAATKDLARAEQELATLEKFLGK